MCVMAVGMGLTMAPATESVMGSLPREKAGVGSAVNDTTRQMGGALGVAIIGTMVASVYSSGVSSIACAVRLDRAQTRRRQGLARRRALAKVAPQLGDPEPAAFVEAAKAQFVDGLSTGLRVGAVIVFIAAMVAFKFLPAFAKDPLAHPERGRRRRRR